MSDAQWEARLLVAVLRAGDGEFVVEAELRAVLVCHRRPVVNLRACKFDDDTALSRHVPTPVLMAEVRAAHSPV